MREKPDSPFYPQKPLPPEKFFGRDDLVTEIWNRDISPVLKHNRTQMTWISGEKGIGKSSLADFLLKQAENKGLLPLRINLSRVHTVDELIERIIYSILEYKQNTKSKIGKFVEENFKTYFEDIKVQMPFFELNFKINKEKVKEDIPEYKRNFEDFLKSFIQALRTQTSDEYTGLFLLLDEINGLAEEPEFANFFKGLSDVLKHHLGLLIMICGTDEKRQAMIKNHESTNRIFSLYTVPRIETKYFQDYFIREFETCDIKFEKKNHVELMSHFCDGQPRFAQVIGDNVFSFDDDFIIDGADAYRGIGQSISDIGEKFIKPLYEEIKSENYKHVIGKIFNKLDDKVFFKRNIICKEFDEKEKQNFDNLIKRMSSLGFIVKRGKGEYHLKDYFTYSYLKLVSSKLTLPC